MQLEITKTENGYHVKDNETNKERCFETMAHLGDYLGSVILKNIGDQVTIKD